MKLSTEETIKLGRILEAIKNEGLQPNVDVSPREETEMGSEGLYETRRWFEVQIKFDMQQETE